MPTPTLPLLSNNVNPFVQAFAPDLYCKFKAPVNGLIVLAAKVPEIEAFPVTLKASSGAVVPIPTLEFVVSRSISPEEMFKAVVEEGRVQVEAAAAERFSAPAEVKANVPDVTVERVRLPEVLVQPDTPPEAKVNAPVELPMLVTAVPVVLIFPIPVTVNPPVPCSKPDPASTPTAVTAPALVTLKLVELINLVKVPVKVKALVAAPAVWVRFKRLVTVPAPVC